MDDVGRRWSNSDQRPFPVHILSTSSGSEGSESEKGRKYRRDRKGDISALWEKMHVGGCTTIRRTENAPTTAQCGIQEGMIREEQRNCTLSEDGRKPPFWSSSSAARSASERSRILKHLARSK